MNLLNILKASLLIILFLFIISQIQGIVDNTIVKEYWFYQPVNTSTFKQIGPYEFIPLEYREKDYITERVYRNKYSGKIWYRYKLNNINSKI